MIPIRGQTTYSTLEGETDIIKKHRTFNFSNIIDTRKEGLPVYVQHEKNSNKNYCELKKFINAFSNKMTLNKDKN